MKKKLLLALTIYAFLTSNANNPGFLGITINSFKSEKLTGVLVSDIIDNSAAQKHGIKENDIITAVNDNVVSTKEELIRMLSTNYSIGDEVRISYVRNGMATTTKVILGKKPEAIKFKMSKTVKADGEHWFFANDKTEIVVKEDNTPVAISKTDENGKVNTLQFASTSFNNVLQNFTDVEDKLLSIKKNKIQVDKCSCKCPITDFTLFKITPDAIVKPEIKSLLVDKFTIAPNPTDGKFLVDFASNEKGSLQLSIIDITGRIVKSEILQNFEGAYSKQYDLKNEAKGAYFVQVQIGDKMTTKKIVLQ